MSSKEYVKMLSDSLDKKVELLRQLQGLNQEQKNILEDSESTPDMLDDNIEKKSDVIERLDKMDEGFQSLYDKVKDDLSSKREEYASEIKHMQEQIALVTDLSTDVQAKEMQNRELARAKFSHIRSQIRETKHGQKAVASYYASMMNNTGYEDSQFWDKKK
ncbi:MAG TPA: flagellin biosynthesis protein FlgN [Lachnospiraceae bacterium]|nr:flagellin biosynthesis protein FlgN [Lachnospiraceae bacterium]